jgi:hypothetical protein
MASSSAALTGDAKIIEPVSMRIMDDLSTGRLNLADITDKQPVEVKARYYPELTNPQIRLLQQILAQESHLHALDLTGLIKQLPFPITQSNYLGRFIAKGCETPQRAARHLQLAIPFLVRMRSLFEGLHNSVLNFLNIDITSAQNGSGPQTNQKRVNHETRRNTIDVIHAAINHSWDFFGKSETDPTKRLTCVAIPRLPDVNVDHIDPKRWNELAIALYDWLLFGDRAHELLNTQKLTPQKEKLSAEYAARLKDGDNVIKGLEEQLEREGISLKEKRSIEADLKKARERYGRVEKCALNLDEERKLVIPLIAQLEDHLSRTPDIRSFRSEVKKAQSAGHCNASAENGN